MQPYIGEITIFAGSFAPKGWLFCDGSTLQVSQFSTLYAVIGNTYGGSGASFKLPNLQERFIVQAGTGPGLSPATIGNHFGSYAYKLEEEQIPAHSHRASVSMMVSNTTASTDITTNTLLANTSGGINPYGGAPDGNLYTGKAIAADIEENLNQDNYISNIQPVVGVYYIIATDGLFPPRG